MFNYSASTFAKLAIGERPNRNYMLTLYAVLAFGTTISIASAQRIESDQVKLIRETVESICNTVKDLQGRETIVEVQGNVKAQLVGLAGKIADSGVSGSGSITNEEFEGLTREALATALQGDRECRERLFEKMYDRPPSAGRAPTPVQPRPAQAAQPAQIGPKQSAASNLKGSSKQAQRIAKVDCRNPPEHYLCDGSGCLHRTPHGVLLGLPQLSQQCPSQH